MDLKKKKTNRGFELYEFKDRYDTPCSLQQSSLAFENAIWFGVDDAEPKVMLSELRLPCSQKELTGWVKYPLPEGVMLTTRMHLTQEQVKDLLPILQKFAETGEI